MTSDGSSQVLIIGVIRAGLISLYFFKPHSDVMMSDVLKKRKVKAPLRGEGGTPPETKRSRDGGGEQQDVGRGAAAYSEWAELDGRDPERDRLQYGQTCESLAKLMGEIQELKANGAATEEDGGGGSSRAEAGRMQRMQSCVHVMTLKRLNRLAHMGLKRARDRTHDAKQKVDVLTVRLQNLLYQVSHWQKAIGGCLEFSSEHDRVDLVSEAEFYQEAPSAMSRPDVTRGDAHRRTLARLNWELEQRKRLAERCTESRAARENTRRSIAVKKEHLSSLQPGLDAIMQASVPVQEYLSVVPAARSSERSARQTEMARHLPASLYVLFVQASAYGRACDADLCVSIAGEVEEAKALSRRPKADDESHSDAEEPDETKRRRSPTAGGGTLDEKRRETLRRHPLSVCLDVKCTDGSVLHLRFCYLTNLDVMTAKTTVTTEPASSAAFVASAGELLKPGTLLDCLVAGGDRARESPNPANRYQLDKVGIASFADYAEELGRPYLWVQKLGGLQFPGDAPEEEGGGGVGGSLSASHMESTVKLLRERLESRLLLHRQFASLENGAAAVPSVSLFPGKAVSSRLTSWTAVSYREYRDLAFTRRHTTDGEETDFAYFVAVVERGGAHLRAAVALDPRYPAVAARFSLSLRWEGEERSASTDDGLRAAESRANDAALESEYGGNRRPGVPQLLTNQVARLCVSLDAYLEADPAERPGDDRGTRSTSVEPDTDSR